MKSPVPAEAIHCDFALVEQFGSFLNGHIPGAFTPDQFYYPRRDLAQRVWRGYLGLMAAVPGLALGPGEQEIRRAKLESHAMHARFALDPDGTLDKIIACSTSFDVTTDPDPLKLAGLTEDQLVNEIEHAKLNATRPTKAFKTKLQKHRNRVTASYGAVDIGGAINAVFDGFQPWSLLLTFNLPVIVTGWGTLQADFGCAPLPATISNANPGDLANADYIAEIFERAIRTAAKANLAVCTISYDALIRDIEQSLNQGTLPTPGAALDADHAVELVSSDIYICRDTKLRENLKSFAGRLGLNTQVVATAKQLKKALSA